MTIKNVICDIDGVLMHDNVAVPGAAEFLHGIMDKGLPLVLLTNYPSQTGQDLANRFATAGVDVPDSVFYTSAMATADFLRRQEGKKAYVVGEGALIHELYKAGFTITDVNPDFVIVGETRSYNWDMMHKAAYFVANGYSAAIFLIPICISFDTAEKRRYATYLILNRRFSFEF